MPSMSKEILAFNGEVDSAARLYLQHWMCTFQTGFLSHPQIPLDREDLRVADIACGTGIWLVDLAQWLLENVELQILDAKGDMPKHLCGTYDVVHVGRIVNFIRDEDPSQLLNNFRDLLKPGGYLYWDEVDLGSLRPKAASPLIEHPSCDKLDKLGKTWLKQQGVTTRWVSEMDNSFEKVGLRVLDYQRSPIGKAMTHPWTLMQLMATRDFIENDVIPSCEGRPDQPSAEVWRSMLEGITKECRQGVSLTMDIVYILGQKPMS